MIAPRIAVTTVRFMDDYCAAYQNIFPEVRSFESFKHLQVGMISEINRKCGRAEIRPFRVPLTFF